MKIIHFVLLAISLFMSCYLIFTRLKFNIELNDEELDLASKILSIQYGNEIHKDTLKNRIDNLRYRKAFTIELSRLISLYLNLDKDQFVYLSKLMNSENKIERTKFLKNVVLISSYIKSDICDPNLYIDIKKSYKIFIIFMRYACNTMKGDYNDSKLCEISRLDWKDAISIMRKHNILSCDSKTYSHNYHKMI